jgi:excisionase family DNA binding protein
MRERQRAKQAAQKPVERAVSFERRQRRERLVGDAPAHLQMYRVAEVAEMFGVSPKTVRRWFQGIAISVEKEGRRTLLISRQDLEEWIARHRGAA